MNVLFILNCLMHIVPLSLLAISYVIELAIQHEYSTNYIYVWIMFYSITSFLNFIINLSIILKYNFNHYYIPINVISIFIIKPLMYISIWSYIIFGYIAFSKIKNYGLLSVYMIIILIVENIYMMFASTAMIVCIYKLIFDRENFDLKIPTKIIESSTKTYKYSDYVEQLNKEQEKEMNVECSICMENYENDTEISELICEHIYHKDCIFEWLGKRGTCPLCRGVFNEEYFETHNLNGHYIDLDDLEA